MNNESWVIIGTETSGMMPPVCAVEIAGQRMKGDQTLVKYMQGNRP